MQRHTLTIRNRGKALPASWSLLAVGVCLISSSLSLKVLAATPANQTKLAASVNSTTASTAGAAKPATSTPVWKPTYPFPHCINTTQSYDVEFVGPLKYMQVGTVKYAYHRFGPLNPSPRRVDAGRGNPGTNSPNSPVMFISGWGLSMYMWPVPLLQRLAEDREVIIFDNMRTGLSTDSSNTTLSIPMMANSTIAMITKLGLQQPDIWSWSVGGCVAYALLAYHPNKVDNVIIAAASPGGPDAYLAPIATVDQIMAIGTNYTAMLPFLFPLGVKDNGVCGFFAAYNSFYSSKHTKLDRPIGLQSIKEQGGAVIRFFLSPDVMNRLSNVPNRVLIMHGVQDKIMPVRNAALADNKLLGSWMLHFPGEGHGIPFSHLQATTYMTQEFFGFANTMPIAELKQWGNYGSTAASRMQKSGR